MKYIRPSEARGRVQSILNVVGRCDPFERSSESISSSAYKCWSISEDTGVYFAPNRLMRFTFVCDSSRDINLRLERIPSSDILSFLLETFELQSNCEVKECVGQQYSYVKDLGSGCGTIAFQIQILRSELLFFVRMRHFETNVIYRVVPWCCDSAYQLLLSEEQGLRLISEFQPLI